MAKKIICLDTSVLIDYFRKKVKEKTLLFKLLQDYEEFCITAITAFEIKYGINEAQAQEWEQILNSITVLPFDAECANFAAGIDKELRKKRKQIAMPDLFIAAITLKNNLPLATLNKKHFDRIEQMKLVE